MILPLLYWPNPKLKIKSEGIDEALISTALMQDLAKNLLDTMDYHRGLGLSAIQVGYPIRMFAIGSQWKPEVWVNPRIVERGPDKEWMSEGCLSLPGFFENVLRHTWVKVVGNGLAGEEKEAKLEGRTAQVFQHECEHLDGKLFVDRLDPGARDRMRATLRKRGH